MYVGGNYAQRAIQHRTDERQFQGIRQRYQLLNPFPEIFLCLALLITHAGSYDTRRRYVDGSFCGNVLTFVLSTVAIRLLASLNDGYLGVIRIHPCDTVASTGPNEPPPRKRLPHTTATVRPAACIGQPPFCSSYRLPHTAASSATPSVRRSSGCVWQRRCHSDS